MVSLWYNSTLLSNHHLYPVVVQCIDWLLYNLETRLAAYCNPGYVISYSIYYGFASNKAESSLFSVVRKFIDDFPQISAFLRVDLALLYVTIDTICDRILENRPFTHKN